jgi:hypothetical protein
MYFVVLLALLSSDDRPFRYALQKDDVGRYLAKQKNTTSTVVGAKKMEFVAEQESTIRWKVTEVDSKKGARISQRVEKFKLSLKGGPIGSKTLDSTQADNPEAVRKLFEDLTSADIAFAVKPNGAVGDVELPAGLKTRLQAKPESGQPTVTYDQIVGMISNTTLVLPDKPLAPGDGWDLPPNTTQQHGHWVTIKNRIEYVGERTKAGRKLREFTRTAEFDLKKVDGDVSGPDAKLLEHSSKSTILLDAATCQLVENAGRERVVTEVSQAGRKVKIVHASEASVKLLGADDASKEANDPE